MLPSTGAMRVQYRKFSPCREVIWLLFSFSIYPFERDGGGGGEAGVGKSEDEDEDEEGEEGRKSIIHISKFFKITVDDLFSGSKRMTADLRF